MAGSALRPFLRTTGSADVIDVREYGAKFDNATDDTAAIQAALDAAVLTGYQGWSDNDLPSRTVVMPSGRAKITSPLQLHANTVLQGNGNGNTFLVNWASTGNTLELATGAETQITLRDFFVFELASGTGIDLSQTSQNSALSDAAHLIENVVVWGGTRALHMYAGNECRIVNFLAYRQTPAGSDGAINIGGTDMMLERVTVAQTQYQGSGQGGSGMWCNTSNTRFVDIKIFGGTATVDGQMSEAFRLIGQRNQVIGLEVQDYAGGGAIGDDQGNNVYIGGMIDSCQGGGFRLDGPGFVSGMMFVNRGGSFTMPLALDIANNTGAVVDAWVVSVADNFDTGQDGTGNFIRINGVTQP